MPTNKAAWIKTAQAHPFEIGDAPMIEPTANEIIVKTHSVAINPADWAVQKYGILIKSYPCSIGCDVAGEVYAVGSEVEGFKPGDRVVGACGLMADRPNRGTFQLYCAVADDLVTILPDNVSYTDGCVLPIAFLTAATALFTKGNMELPYPRLQPQPSDKIVFIWGGSSSVGCCAIQLAKAVGFEVATTCSMHNAELCRNIGADHVFDHKKDGVVQEILTDLKGKTLAGVFDAVMPPETISACAQIAHELDGNRHVMTVLTGINGQLVPEGLPSDVKTGYTWCTRINEAGPVVWRWLTEALADGSMQCKPNAEVVGHGLEAIQEAVDRIGQGVSAKKLVVEIA